jgi:hypothetical protein
MFKKCDSIIYRYFYSAFRKLIKNFLLKEAESKAQDIKILPIFNKQHDKKDKECSG